MSQGPRWVVLDASVLLKWQLDDDEHIPQAIALRDDFYLRGTIKAIAPQLMVYGVANGIATASRQRRLAPDMAVQALTNLMALGVELREVQPSRVLELALRHELAAYDAAYLALAEEESCELWTGDRPFYQAVKGKSPWAKWIGDYPSQGKGGDNGVMGQVARQGTPRHVEDGMASGRHHP